MKYLLFNIFLFFLTPNAIAETASEAAKRSLTNRFKFAIEGVLFALIFTALAFAFAKIVKLIFKKDIGSEKYYGYSLIIGFGLHYAILVLLKNK